MEHIKTNNPLNEICKYCGYELGVHRVDTHNCPLGDPYTAWKYSFDNHTFEPTGRYIEEDKNEQPG